MISRSYKIAQDDDNAGAGRPAVSRREVISIRETQEELASAHCPLCRAILVVRQGRAGPYFFCQCLRRAS
jgi:hypothetical protein